MDQPVTNKSQRHYYYIVRFNVSYVFVYGIVQQDNLIVCFLKIVFSSGLSIKKKRRKCVIMIHFFLLV